MTKSDRNRHDRLHWESLWQGTLWERFDDGCWSPLEPRSAVPLVVITAWNPGGLRLPGAVNQARDVVLHGELCALGLIARRARGRSPSADWCEDGWQIPHELARTTELLCRYGQIAGWVTDPAGAHLHWSGVVPPS